MPLRFFLEIYKIYNNNIELKKRKKYITAQIERKHSQIPIVCNK